MVKNSATTEMEAFCYDNAIKMAHGSQRTPTTQGLVERANRTSKEDTRALIAGTAKGDLKKWCQFSWQASYVMNLTFHKAIKISPYEAVYGIKPHREHAISHANNNQPAAEPEMEEEQTIESEKKQWHQNASWRQSTKTNQAAKN